MVCKVIAQLRLGEHTHKKKKKKKNHGNELDVNQVSTKYIYIYICSQINRLIHFIIVYVLTWRMMPLMYI